MAEITLSGNAINTNGDLPEVGSQAPDFVLTGGELTDFSLKDYAGKKVLMSIVPSLDTGVCATSTKKFNQHFANNSDVVALIISADLPFAQSRFCMSESLENVVSLSMMRSRDFANDYGVMITDGPLAGISARGIVVLDESGKVVYTELVPEIAQEPDYDAALAALG